MYTIGFFLQQSFILGKIDNYIFKHTEKENVNHRDYT